MNYAKPKLEVLAGAIDAIRSSQTKGQFDVLDNVPAPTRATQAAYEADE